MRLSSSVRVTTVNFSGNLPLGPVCCKRWAIAWRSAVAACGHDADQGSLSDTHDKTLAEDLWIAAEFALPSAVIQDKHERRIGATIFFRDRAAKQRRHAQIIEGVGRNSGTERQSVGEFAVVVEEPTDGTVGDHFFEHLILLAEGAEFLVGEGGAAFGCAGVCSIANFKYDGAIEIFVGKRLEEDVVDDAEDDCGRAYAKSQSENGDRSETAVFAKIANGVAEIAEEIVEVGFPARIADLFLNAF